MKAGSFDGSIRHKAEYEFITVIKQAGKTRAHLMAIASCSSPPSPPCGRYHHWFPGSQVIQRETLGARFLRNEAFVIVAHALAIDGIDFVMPLFKPGH